MEATTIVISIAGGAISILVGALFWAFQTYVNDELAYRDKAEVKLSDLKNLIDTLSKEVTMISVKTNISNDNGHKIKSGMYANKKSTTEAFDNLNKKLDAEIRSLSDLIRIKERESRELQNKIAAIFQVVDRAQRLKKKQ